MQQRRAQWILWLKPYDDNWGRWEKAIAIARCPRKGLLYYDKDAAMILLAAALAEDIRLRDFDLDRFHMVTNTGLLSMKELDAVANSVWSDERSPRPMTGG